MNPEPEMTDVFQLMELRAPYSPEAKSLRQNYIRDDFVGFRNDKPQRIDADLQSDGSPSAIGRLVYRQVFCTPDAGNPAENVHRLINELLKLLKPYQPYCQPARKKRPPATTDEAAPLSILELERRAYIQQNGLYYLLPEHLDQTNGLTLFPELARALEVMERARMKFDLPLLVKQLMAVFKGKPLHEVVFQQGIYAKDFQSAKRTLFDTLYLLYILRRRTTVNLEYVIEGLRALHVLEALAIDSLIEVIKTSAQLSPADESLRRTLEVLFPELQGWNGSDKLQTLPLIESKADFEAYLTATPIIHPIFARLHWYRFPFNDIKPIGIGDLKVVKQWLTAYLPGEISHIENVLKGEIKDRTHRRLEKTEESFSFSGSSKESSQKDTQSTERFELKREAENVVKTNLNVGANASVTGSYSYGTASIVANVGANFSYNRETNDQKKASNIFARDVISKAVEQIEKNVTETRSVTKIFETEEINKHGFDNSKSPSGHVTGIYRWIDKKYKAQLFNYGKRMMFEFIIPEPAAFFVEARLRALEAMLDVPQPPKRPVLKQVSLKLSTGLEMTPGSISESEFPILQQKYELAEFTYPQLNKRMSFSNPETGDNFFEKVGGASDNDSWSAETFRCKHKADGYELKSLTVEGILRFGDTSGDTGTGPAENILVILIDGIEVVRHRQLPVNFIQYSQQNFNVKTTISGQNGSPQTTALQPPLILTGDEVALTIGLWDRNYFGLTISAELKRSAAVLGRWQLEVFNKIKDVEQQKVDKENQELLLEYNSQLSTYRNRLAELKAQTINDLLQGQSEAFNREIIRTELKKHCLTLLTKEFDANDYDDLLSRINPIRVLSSNFAYRRFKVTEDSVTNTTSGSFEETSKQIGYPFIELDGARRKGRYIQFLEQAFEWQQVAYLFYPYFWATLPKWIEMMSRADDADANLTAFLQAGSARVLLAVTPAYEEAVLHFLATREPWEGGPAPAIGDPLFIPLHEELRKRQDDLYNAVPEGKPWTFTLPTSLVYLDDSGVTLPTFPDIQTP